MKMVWTNLRTFLALMSFIFGCAAFPASQTKNELKQIVSSLIGQDHQNPSADQPEAPPEVNREGPVLDRKPDTDILGDYGRFGKQPFAKRVPWYNRRNYYDGYKRIGGFDSINHYSSFGKFQKRKPGKVANEADVDEAENLVDRLKRAAFDSIHHYSDFGRFNKRSVDRASFERAFVGMPSWKRRAFDSIHHYSDFGKFSKRK